MTDLTKIEKPFGLLDAETQAALRDHGGPYECVFEFGWVACEAHFFGGNTYRVKPQPVRGEVKLFGRVNGAFGALYSKDTHRLTLPILNSDLIPGTYTGPDGATITIEALQ